MILRRLVLVAALGAALAACSVSSSPHASSEREAPAADRGAPDPRRMVADGAVLLDVRTSDEFSAGHLDGAVNIPIDDLEARLGELPRDRDVVVYCRSGRRSAHAATLLGAAGFAVHDLGPMTAW